MILLKFACHPNLCVTSLAKNTSRSYFYSLIVSQRFRMPPWCQIFPTHPRQQMVSFLQQNGLAAPILQDKSFGQGVMANGIWSGLRGGLCWNPFLWYGTSTIWSYLPGVSFQAHLGLVALPEVWWFWNLKIDNFSVLFRKSPFPKG